MELQVIKVQVGAKDKAKGFSVEFVVTVARSYNSFYCSFIKKKATWEFGKDFRRLNFL